MVIFNSMNAKKKKNHGTCFFGEGDGGCFEVVKSPPPPIYAFWYSAADGGTYPNIQTLVTHHTIYFKEFLNMLVAKKIVFQLNEKSCNECIEHRFVRICALQGCFFLYNFI